jgi:hypothetical protein
MRINPKVIRNIAAITVALLSVFLDFYNPREQERYNGEWYDE